MENPFSIISDKIPDELKDHYFLNYFATSKYFALLCDEKGTVLWGANREVHKYSLFLENLCGVPISANYFFPAYRDLNEVMAEKRIQFASRNIFEKRYIGHPFVLTFPLTNLVLLKISRTRFLGIISFSEFFQELYLMRARAVILEDYQERVAGYNDLFAGMLGLQKADELIGRPISEVVEISGDERESMSADLRGRMTASVEWKCGEPPPFDALQSAQMKMDNSEKGLFLENQSTEKYGYLMFRKPLPLDVCHMEMELEFEQIAPCLPNLVLRGAQYSEASTPDLDGYTLSMTPVTGAVVFKKATEPVFYLPVTGPLEPGLKKIAVRKYYNNFSFYCNNTEIGFWKEELPFSDFSDDLLYVFLRPGEKVLLKSISIRKLLFREMASPAGRKPLTATIRYKPLDYQFRVSAQQRAVAGINFRLFQFEDVTEFHRDISSLKSQRDQLVSLLKPEIGFIGRSPLVMDIRMNLETVAKSNLTVLIEGETGTGKEVLARAIHQAGPRKGKPFVKVDCSALPENLLESELFGHERGAFTGALSTHVGRFEQAQGGVVFLDEVGNLPPQIQAKLLGVLQDFKVQRIGGLKSIQLDIHLITATNIPLKSLIGRGIFREDLYYRLNQFCFTLPPLRDRREDIPLLAEAFIKEGDLLYNKSVQGLSSSAMDRIYNAPWPGNIRELRNVLLRAVLFSTSALLEAEEIRLESASAADGGQGTEPARKRGGPRKKTTLIRESVVRALQNEAGNISLAAQQLNVSRFLAYKLIRKFRIKLDKFRQ